MLNRNDPNGDGLEGCRVLAILPLSRKERTRYVFDILAAAKTRWNWHIDVICQSTDKKPFDDLVAPTGSALFAAAPVEGSRLGARPRSRG